ncbi:hypothetical protein DL766_004479 [Monosporascus sp. MC13-8B]|uniref:DUF3074 domain-containing protein n=1 Tax=Monosporascus cannonballus TaxID=155416 RepID=A0ABY0H484_9PEZI|nr:hypothetical protein DL762_007174 [Monosporascus cannonballus]RYP31171.1 hypothetical protein DL766_004479 [Monosporascus sp. MC13-8B]
MAKTHEPFKALGHINWEYRRDPSAGEEGILRNFLTKTFKDAECIVDSIPGSSASGQQFGRPRSSTDPNRKSLHNRAHQASDIARELRKEWKEVKVNPKENPLGLSVYKLAAKDGRGSWFARRSVHEGQSFDKWKAAMEREFLESMKVKGKPGSGSIRGIGADKRVERMAFDGCGKLEGFIRGSYESVEVIREIRCEPKVDPLRRVQSSIDLPADEANAIARHHEHVVRSAHHPAADDSGEASSDGRQRGKTVAVAGAEGSEQQGDAEYETKIEWLMVTRSDPGGSVPRFMVEKGTPGGIAGDADKFLKWVDTKSMKDLTRPEEEVVGTEAGAGSPDAKESTQPSKSESQGMSNNARDQAGAKTVDKYNAGSEPLAEEEGPPAVPGIYGMIANAIGAAASVLPNPFGYTQGGDAPLESSPSIEDDDDDDKSSIHTFLTVQENLAEDDPRDAQLSRANSNGEEQSTISSNESTTTHSFNGSSLREKELRKLEERKRKLEDRLKRSQNKALSKRNHEGASNDDLAKLREKHEREVLKHKEKFEREMQKLEAKRINEERKAEERRRKQAEREEKNTLSKELEKVRAERDVARKQIEVLKEQIGELQGQNTMLVARLGREGITLEGGMADMFSDLRKKSSPGPGGKLSRTSTIHGHGIPSHVPTPSPASSTARVDRLRERATHMPAEGVA